jgi:hypothetical protein
VSHKSRHIDAGEIRSVVSSRIFKQDGVTTKQMMQPKVKLLFVAAIFYVIVAAPLAHAEECRYEDNRTDDFTGEKILTTKWKLFHSATNVSRFAAAAGVTEGDSDFLAIKRVRKEILAYDLYGDELRNRFVVPKDARLLILLADDTVVELAAHKEVTGVSRSSSANSQLTEDSELKIRYRIETIAVVRYPLDDDSYAALTSQPATHVRLSAIDGDHDFKVDKKLTDEIQKALLCLKQETV